MGEDPAMAAPARYRAFISYSHADARFAHWLHRKLESWRLPDKTRLSPVFIDRAELAAGSDLSAQVRAALNESGALIVVCSPNARASRWVGQEIALFRELHPDRPVLAALIAGEPGEAFPDPLLAVGDQSLEPLAADFRKGHDGQRLGLLKLVAGLTALPLDRLVQRDAQSRQRRVMAVTAAALVLILILSAALVTALRARAEAERQRAEAEGLVEFMLTDLRDKLKGVGRLDVMDAVNQRAMAYYGDQQSLRDLLPESLDRRARILHAMGEDDEKRGELAMALLKFKEAHRTTAAQLAQKPSDPDAIFAHAQSEYWVGEAEWQRNDRAATTQYWIGYLRHAELLAKVEPNSVRSQMELGYAHGNICDLLARDNFDLEGAVRACQRAIDFERAALQKRPSDHSIQQAIANRHGWLAEVLLNKKNFDHALAERAAEAQILQSLISTDPKNVDLQRRLLESRFGAAKTSRRSGRFEQAVKLLAAVAIATERQIALQPADATLFLFKARVHIEMATAKKFGAHADWQASLKVAEEAVSAYLHQAGDTAQAGRLKQRIQELKEDQCDACNR